MNSWVIGSRVSLAVSLTDPVTGQPTDPANPVRLNYQIPGLAITRLTYGVDTELVKDSVGNYHAEVDCEAVGVVQYRWWTSPGPRQFAIEGEFQILPTTLL